MSTITGHIDRLRAFEFWREGCHTFTKNVVIILELADKDWDSPEMAKFLQTLPTSRCELASEEWQKSYCNQCLEKAYTNSPDGAREAVEYFLMYFTDRNYDAQAMLINALLGIDSGIDAAAKELKGGEHEQKIGPGSRPDNDGALPRPAGQRAG